MLALLSDRWGGKMKMVGAKVQFGTKRCDGNVRYVYVDPFVFFGRVGEGSRQNRRFFLGLFVDRSVDVFLSRGALSSCCCSSSLFLRRGLLQYMSRKTPSHSRQTVPKLTQSLPHPARSAHKETRGKICNFATQKLKIMFATVFYRFLEGGEGGVAY